MRNKNIKKVSNLQLDRLSCHLWWSVVMHTDLLIDIHIGEFASETKDLFAIGMEIGYYSGKDNFRRSECAQYLQ